MAQSRKQTAAALAAQERKEAVQAAALEQATMDEAVKPSSPSMKGIKPGQQVPLHMLNVAQREQDRAMKDVNREAATAAAKAVSKVLSGERQGASVHGPNTAAAHVPQNAPAKPKTGLPSKAN